MKNFLISSLANIILIFTSYFIFRSIVSGPTRHKLYEKLFNSMAKFIIYIFITSIGITAITALILYRTRFISYINIIAPALVSIFIGFIMSTVPTRGVGDKSKN
ncbi:hypothetical protein CLOACE_09270 [Clostridium acetireducens DSM 10703]|jgi:hypothetical protein|uniref:Uncharacterized protein n=1 Tax=Clostridium acetireducens DSM 10703 TaxID=1121290 RepID=A0A1E8EZL9_9CLOT|nr:hypothetical protein [Clostridium acetireducens]OFI06586.1 hypothetical protein CLOACE_09270 [Clostridium acetireducens DSM 10703]